MRGALTAGLGRAYRRVVRLGTRDEAIAALRLTGVRLDSLSLRGVPIGEESDLYLIEYARARLEDLSSRSDSGFNEEDHPRAEDGKFTSGGGSASEAKTRPEPITKEELARERVRYRDLLDEDELFAAKGYASESYKEINGGLRKGKVSRPYQDTIEVLDRAIAKAPAPRDMVVYRGMHGAEVRRIWEGLKPGDEYSDKGYTSTSAGELTSFAGSIRLTISVPKGYPAAPIPSNDPKEAEYLLPRGSTFRVVSIEKSGDTLRAHVEVVRPKP